MQKCRELSRLPKATAIKSLNFKRTTPGALGPILGDLTGLTVGPLDGTHPAAKLRKPALFRAAPYAQAPGFILRVFPQAVLHRLRYPRPVPPFISAPVRGPGAPRVNVSLLKVVGAKVSRSAVVRSKIGSKIKTAFSMIVSRGADVEKDMRGKDRIVFREEDVSGDKWILPDWTYLAMPTLEIYRMPYQVLIPALRNALIAIKRRAQGLEAKEWSRPQDQPGASQIPTSQGSDYQPYALSQRDEKPASAVEGPRQPYGHAVPRGNRSIPQSRLEADDIWESLLDADGTLDYNVVQDAQSQAAVRNSTKEKNAMPSQFSTSSPDDSLLEWGTFLSEEPSTSWSEPSDSDAYGGPESSAKTKPAPKIHFPSQSNHGPKSPNTFARYASPASSNSAAGARGLRRSDSSETPKSASDSAPRIKSNLFRARPLVKLDSSTHLRLKK
ncbi:hypothetical protein AcW1_010267 [Taiwanofungus camphoratus]|nr:hypothetical protein AcV7_002120 [Antrodia cinnamomea]KAI0943435.1 hypothetical protein AcW1_010267 [Antrodia cinnamomea]